jgi:hypothetical protein
VHRYMEPLMEHIRAGDVDPGFVITHRLPLAEAPRAYRMFRDKRDGCEKVVLTPCPRPGGRGGRGGGASGGDPRHGAGRLVRAPATRDESVEPGRPQPGSAVRRARTTA